MEHLVPVAPGQYAVASDVGKRLFGKVMSVNEGDSTFVFRPELDREHPITLPLSEVISCLGADPFSGTAFGVKTDARRRVIEHPFFGEIEVFLRTDKDLRKMFLSSMDQSAAALKRFGFKPPNASVKWMPSSGKYSGLYRHSSDAEKLPHSIEFTPKVGRHLDPDSPDLEHLKVAYVGCHEYGHYYWFNFVSQKYRNLWLQLFDASNKPKKSSREEVAAQFKEFKKAASVSDFLSPDDENLKWVRVEILRSIKADRGIDKRDLQDMHESHEMWDEIWEIWPDKTMTSRHAEIFVTEYGTKNVREFFAEAFSFYVTETKLQDPVLALMKKTISQFGSGT